MQKAIETEGKYDFRMRHYFENKIEVIGFASPRIGKVLKFRGHEVSEEF